MNVYSNHNYYSGKQKYRIISGIQSICPFSIESCLFVKMTNLIWRNILVILHVLLSPFVLMFLLPIIFGNISVSLPKFTKSSNVFIAEWCYSENPGMGKGQCGSEWLQKAQYVLFWHGYSQHLTDQTWVANSNPWKFGLVTVILLHHVQMYWHPRNLLLEVLCIQQITAVLLNNRYGNRIIEALF